MNEPRRKSMKATLSALNAPDYETEVRNAAAYLRKKADGFCDLPVVFVQISPEFARFIAGLLENHADDVEKNRG